MAEGESRAERLAKMMGVFAHSYGRVVDKEMVGTYDKILADIPIDLLARAGTNYLYDPSHRFFPAPAQLREEAVQILNPMLSVEDAWLTVMIDLQDGLLKGIPAHYSEMTRAAIKACGGTYVLRQSMNLYTVERLFRDTYNAVCKRMRRELCSIQGTRDLLKKAKDVDLLKEGDETK